SIASIYVHDCTNANIKITGNTFDGYGSTSILTDDSADNILFELNHCKGSEPAYFDTKCILVNTIDANLNLSCHAAIYSNKMHKNKSKITIRRNVFTGKITGENVNNCVKNNEDFNLIVENNENY
ncbi:MAG: hypothetical protein MJ236_03995, partial [Clostridia bacterium]|nr:hypothetical protein [Clostridia bacterium]